jgi:membrane protein implicated in regulation of membrane protease activity
LHQAEFTANSKIIIENIFTEHTNRRCLQLFLFKFKTIAPTCIATIVSIQNITTLIAWTFFGVGFIVLTILSALFLFQYVERKLFQTRDDKIQTDKILFLDFY